MGSGSVAEQDVRQMIGAVDKQYLYELLAGIVNQDGEALLAKAQEMAARAIGFDSALSELAMLLGQFKIPIRVTSNSDLGITFRIEKYLVGTNNMNDLYYYINYKYGSNIKSNEEFLNTLPVIPLLQEYDTFYLIQV